MFHLLSQSQEPAVSASQVTTAWMAGVVAIMLLFGAIAVVGYLRKKFVLRE